MKPSKSEKTISSLEIEIYNEERKYQEALKSGAEFQELKEIKQTIRQLKNTLLKMSISEPSKP